MISNVYNYYMSQYGIKSYNKHNTHRKDELRNIYNSIVKINRASPFYDVDVSEESQKYAIDIKEKARALYDVTAELTDVMHGETTFKSVAVSDRPDNLTAEYIGDNLTAGTSREFTIAVKQLATPQINTGTFLNQNSRSLYTGRYSFDVDIASITYELQFGVNDKENNRNVQDKLARLINNSNIGLKAEVLTNEQNRSALQITSNMTGMSDKPVIFRVSDENTTALSGAVETLGLDNTTQYPSNAVFELNGDEKVSASNVFTVDRRFEITLQKVNEPGEYAVISLKQDMDAVVDSIHELADNYNKIYTLARNGSSYASHKLANELSYTAGVHKDALASSGLMIKEDGTLNVDDDKLCNLTNDRLMSMISELTDFKDELQKKANNIMINPMEFINKTVISYKNPAHPGADTYSTSIYTGMMYNGYC